MNVISAGCRPFFILFIFVFSSTYAGAKNSSFKVRGQVYLDKNKNGIREANEPGVGGVEIQVGELKATTFHNGEFSLKAPVGDNLSKINLITHTLPAGSILTSSPLQILNKSGFQSNEVSFGVWIPQDKFLVKKYPKYSDDKMIKVSTAPVVWELKGTSLYLSGVEVSKLKQLSEIYSYQEHVLTYDKTTLNFEDGLDEMKLFFTKHNKKLSHFFFVEFGLPKGWKKNGKRSEILESSLRREIKKELPISDFSIKFKKNKETKVSVRHQFTLENKSNCIVSGDEGTTSQLSNLSKVSYPIEGKKTHKSILTCGKESFTFMITFDPNKRRLMVEKNNKQITIPISWSDVESRKVKASFEETEDLFEVEGSKYFDQSRDLKIHFKVKSLKYKRYTLNGIPYSGLDAHDYLYEGVPGANQLSFIPLVKKKELGVFKYQFDLLKLPTFYFEPFMGKYSQKSISNKFDVNYKIESITRAGLKTQFYFNKSFGVNLKYTTDTTGSSFRKFDGSSTEAKHTNMQGHLVYRHRWNERDYKSIQLKYYLGFQKKDFPLDENVNIHFPEGSTGAHFGFQLLKEPFLFEELGSSTSVFYGFSNPENHDFTISQELRLNLNKLGKLFGTKPHFVYRNRYGYWHKFRLVVGIEVERDRTKVQNIPNARVKDEKVIFKTGLAFQF